MQIIDHYKDLECAKFPLQIFSFTFLALLDSFSHGLANHFLGPKFSPLFPSNCLTFPNQIHQLEHFDSPTWLQRLCYTVSSTYIIGMSSQCHILVENHYSHRDLARHVGGPDGECN